MLTPEPMDDAFYAGPLIHSFISFNVKNYILLPKKKKSIFKGSKKKRMYLIYSGIYVNENIKYSKCKQLFRSPVCVLCDQV